MEEQSKRQQSIIVEILKTLEENGCTAAEAFEILEFTRRTIMSTAKVNADWPKR